MIADCEATGEVCVGARPAIANASHGRSALRWAGIPSVDYAAGTGLEQAVARRQPVVLTGLADSWPALERWQPERLAARYGEQKVRVYDASFGEPGENYMGNIATMTFAEFLQTTQSGRRDLRLFLYNLVRQIPALLDDIQVPTTGLRFSRRFVFSFFGCQGATTPLHYDIDQAEVLHTVITGRRRVRLFGPTSSRALYRHPFTVRSYVDLDQPDLGRFPALTAAQGYEAILEPGQTLYMPPGWWHEFHYLEAGMGVSLRAPASRWRDRARGWLSLLVTSPVDRLGNRCAPGHWYAWKRRRADRLAAAIRTPESSSLIGRAERV